jgi:hypothetical protein
MKKIVLKSLFVAMLMCGVANADTCFDKVITSLDNSKTCMDVDNNSCYSKCFSGTAEQIYDCIKVFQCQ